jgi:hypothetical protein
MGVPPVIFARARAGRPCHNASPTAHPDSTESRDLNLDSIAHSCSFFRLVAKLASGVPPLTLTVRRSPGQFGVHRARAQSANGSFQTCHAGRAHPYHAVRRPDADTPIRCSPDVSRRTRRNSSLPPLHSRRRRNRLRQGLTTHHSPLTTHHSPLTSHLSPLTSHLSPLTSHLARLLLKADPHSTGHGVRIVVLTAELPVIVDVG